MRYLVLSIVLLVVLPANGQQPREITNSIGMKLVLIPKGTFTMGSPTEEEGRESNEVQHLVTISRDYFLGAFEVTQAQYQRVMGENPSYFQGDKIKVDSLNHPVDNVSWQDAVEFCKRLSELPEEKKAGHVYRLPTEGQWEYACRAGSKTAFSFGANLRLLGDYAWWNRISTRQTHPVGGKKPNAWGLYDMYGNVHEWCSDVYGEYPKGAVTDPTGSKEGSSRVSRGGHFVSYPSSCRSAFRFWFDDPSIRERGNGFRIALSSSGVPK